MPDKDPFENDPFFKMIPDGEWNAAVGRQGHEENYVDGFIEAAIELTESILQKKLYGQRDTLILPILYNARHGLELSLKFATQKLVAAGIIKDDNRELSHDIAAYWNHLDASAVGDQKFAALIKAIKIYVDSLAQVDSDGQELRYPTNRDGKPSLDQFAIINFRLMRISLHRLQNLLTELKYRTLSLVDEHATGTFTACCSRSDLLEIARALPPRVDWDKEYFDERKAEITKRFGLGSRQFSLALKKLQECREMKGIIGVETPLLHISDETILWVISEWRKVHPKRDPDEKDEGLAYFDLARIEKLLENDDVERAAIKEVANRLSPPELADLEVLFYLSREMHYCEEYEPWVPRKLAEHAVANDGAGEVQHLLRKTNFLVCVSQSAKKLGRLRLAEALASA